jgi:nucleoside-diphosphate-sugar epimerase
VSRPVLVTGAFGMLGSRITAQLLARGVPVVAVDLDTPLVRKKARALAATPTFVDLTDAERVRTLIRQTNPRAILHVAAVIPPVAYLVPHVVESVNVDGTRNLVEALQAIGSDARLVLASSVSVHGSRNGAKDLGLLTADTPLRPSEIYGRSKVQAEEILRGSGLPWTILRLGGLLGTEVLKNLNREMLFLESIVPTDNRLESILVDDAATCFLAAIDAPCDGATLLVGGGETHRHRQAAFNREVMRLAGLVVPQGRDTGHPGNPHDDHAWFYTDWMDVEPTFDVLGFRPCTWDETVRRIRADLSPLRRPLAPLGRVAPRVLRRLSPYRDLPGRHAHPLAAIQTRYGSAALGSVVPAA